MQAHVAKVRVSSVVIMMVVLVTVTACSASTGGQGATTTSVAGNGSATTPGSSRPRTANGADAGALPDSDIELAHDVVVIKTVPGKTVKAIGNDGASLLLDGGNGEVKKLEVGSVMLLTGIGAGRVTEVSDIEGNIGVYFEPVMLGEVIEDGELNWDKTTIDPAAGRVILSPDMAEVSGSPVELAPGSAPAAMDVRDADNPDPDGNKVEGTADKFKFEFEWKPGSDGGGNLKLDLTPSTDFQGKISADVQFEPLTFGGGTKVSGGKVDFFDLDFKNLKGTAKITGDLTALKQTAAITTAPFFKIPVSVSFPVPIGGIPFSLTLSATIQVNLSMALTQNSLHGEADVSFGGTAGFKFNGASVAITGDRSASAKDLLQKMQGVANGPVGLVFTTELPKVGFGLKIAQTGAGVFVSNGMVTSFWIAQAPVPCRRVQVASVVAGGIDASFLGADITFTRKAFLDKRWSYFTPKDDKRCDAIGE